MRMVQRKLVDKHGIQADHEESKKGSSSSQNQDSKNKGASDKKKMMGKSRSIQHLDFESLRSAPLLRSKDSAQRAKAATSDHVNTRAATTQRQSLEESPNYMKSTSSFEARRERCQVSSRTPQNSVISKNLSPVKSNNSRHNSGSDHKPVGAVARTSSSKVVRTLIKTPSFKPARASKKIYFPTALHEDFDVQKPTCASTLKDFKMPMSLELCAGATESEGTSAIKVCPYTYCSLNGHHHAPLPPLKSFLSAKRRMLKAQKVIKLGCLSAHRAKPSQERMVKCDAKQVILVEIPLTKGMDFDSRPITPLMHTKKTDFFVEIHRKNRDDHTAKGKIPESLASTTPGFVNYFEGYLEAEKDKNVEAGAKIHQFPKPREDEVLDCLSTKCNTDEESQQITQYAQSDSKASEKELREERHYERSLNDVSNLKLKVTDIYNRSNIESISNSDSNSNNSNEDLLTDKVQVGFYDEKSVSSGTWSDDGDSDLNGSYHNMDLEKPYFACNKQIQGKIYSTCDENHESVETPVREKSISHPMEEFQAIGVEQSKVPEASDEILRMNSQGDESTKQERESWLLYRDFIEIHQDETHKNHNETFNNMEVFELDSTSESRSSDNVFNESFLANTKYEDADQESHEEKISITDATEVMEKRKQKLLAVESQTFKLSQEFLQQIAEYKNQSKQTDVTIVSETNQSDTDKTPPYERNGVENQEFTEINQDQLQTYEFKSSKIFEDQMHSGPAVLKATPNQNLEADTGEDENRTESNAEEKSIITKVLAISQKRYHMSNANSTSNEEMTQIAKHLSWRIGSRNTARKMEDIGDFNPREPNYLPVESEIEPEKVDLRHQLMDERKNSEEWMVDYALRQAVTKLAPARSRKVSLLVEAFEKVLPAPKYETRLNHPSSDFIQAGAIQTCR